MGNLIIGGLVLLMVLAAGRQIYKDRKNGKTCGSCSGCSGDCGKCMSRRDE